MKNMISEGQDSFLDIIANLVGILIILVVLVGAQASQQTTAKQDAVDDAAQDELDSLSRSIDKQTDQAVRLRRDNLELEQRIVQENQLAAALSDRRHRALVQLELVKGELQKKNDQFKAQLATFDQAQQQQRQQEVELATAEQTLDKELGDVQAKTVALVASYQPPVDKTLTHYPNPIAKTVFSREIHFRLAGGKLSWVPLDELIVLMKDQWRVEAEALKTVDRTVQTVGPVAGFRLQYQLAAQDVGPPGARRGRQVRFDHFKIIPQPTQQGETIDVALAEGSAFRRALADYEPRKTTVSVWLYPDGFGDHRKIKNWLYENGFQMASWPLEFGRQITGGPNGFKTSAQ